jgi:hypothetical protein
MDNLCCLFQNLNTIDSIDEYFLLAESFFFIKNNHKLDESRHSKTKERYLRYLRQICWDERPDIEEAIYRFLNSYNYIDSLNNLRYIDVEIWNLIEGENTFYYNEAKIKFT